MLLKDYRLEIFRSKCHSEHESLHCFAHLNQDIKEVIPYLNAEWEADSFTADPPSATLKWHGKLVTVHQDKIAVNALSDQVEAEKIIALLQREINDIWERRDEIEPMFSTRPQPSILEILKMLPRTNCTKCNQPTCMVFGNLLIQGGVEISDCPDLPETNRTALDNYLRKGQLSQ
jgi:ArsR family metal-binding transcriptional regulator